MFSPQDFLNFAKVILDCNVLSKNEALCRSVISRAYYAAFLSAREKIDNLEPLSLFHPRQDMHQQVAEVLKTSLKFYSQEESLSDDLHELQIYRVDADYHFPNACKSYEKRYKSAKNPDMLQTAENCYLMAENIIDRVNLLR